MHMSIESKMCREEIQLVSHADNYMEVDNSCEGVNEEWDDILNPLPYQKPKRKRKIPHSLKEDYYLLKCEDGYYLYIQKHGCKKQFDEFFSISEKEARMFLLGEISEDWNTRDIKAYKKEFGKDVSTRR